MRRICTPDAFILVLVLLIVSPVFSCYDFLPPTAITDIVGYSLGERDVEIDLDASLTFTGERSYDNDAYGMSPPIRVYRWYVKEPGSSTWELKKESSSSSDKTYECNLFTSVGEYKIRLRVRDNDSQWSVDSQTTYNTCTVTVLDDSPEVENRPPDVLADNSVILNGHLVSSGDTTTSIKIYYDTQDQGLIENNWANSSNTILKYGTGDFASDALTGFQAACTYYFRCYAWGDSGDGWDENTDLQVRTFKFQTAPGQAFNPTPGNSQDVVVTLDALAWSAGTGASEHRIYLGTSEAAVADADASSSVYKGATETASYEINEPLSAGQTYYWRVDEVLLDEYNGDAERVRKGTVWSFDVLYDSDGDGMPDDWELLYGLDPDDPDDADYDADGDGLTNLEEYLLGANPLNYDTDGDGIDDGWEVTFGSAFAVGEQAELDPLTYDAHEKTVGGIPAIWWYTWWTYCNEHSDPVINAMRDTFEPTVNNAQADPDGDGLTNYQEWQNGTNPTVCNADDFWIEYEYDEAGNVIQERQVVYEEDQGSLLDVCIAETVSDYDHLGRQWRQRRKVNPDGADNNSLDEITLTRYYVDNSVHKSVRKGANGTNPSAIEEVYDVIVVYTYDSLGRQLTVTNAMSEVTTYSYAPDSGHLESVTLPGTNREMVYAYDGAGRVVATTNPEGHYETRQYNSRGQVIKQMLYEDDTMAEAVMQRRMGYDSLGTLIWDALMADASSTAPEDSDVDKVTITEVHYNDPNKLINTVTYSSTGEIVDSTWSWSDIDFDASGRGLPTMIQKGYCSDDASQPLIRQHIIYDKAGRTLERYTDHYDSRDDEQPTLTQKIEMEYDAYGRLAASIAVGHTANPSETLRTEYAYRGSYRIAEIDPKQLRTAFDYDALGRMTLKTEDADGLARETVYQYNRLGNLTTLEAFDGVNTQTTSYTYDKGGNVTQITYPDSGTIAYQYSDPAAGGRPTQRTDQRSITTVYTYDKLGNLLQKQNAPSSPTVVETYTYDPRGLMKTAVKVVSSVTVSSIAMDYNGLGYMTESSQTIRGGTPRTVSYERNPLGQPVEIGYPTDTPMTLDYTYTSLGQVETIARGATQLVDYSYAGSMVTGREYPQADVTFTPEYDDFGRVTRHTTVNSSNAGVDFAYEYDDNGNITQQDYLHRGGQPVNAFDYDDLNRLWKADYGFGGGYEQFNYDLLGNRGSVVDTRAGGGTCNYTHNVANEYLTVCSVSVAHDDAGNLMADHRGYVYEYDMENRLTKVSRSDSTLVATFEYDALGRRIEKVDTIAGITKRYYYDDQRVAVQTQVVGAAETDQRYFVFGNYIDEVLVMRNLTGSPAETYYAHDHLYSPVALFDDTGTVVERYEYDAYGQVQILTSAFYPLTSSQHGNPYTFTGRELDTLDTGDLRLMYYRARTYDPQTGRFMQRDPLGINPAGSFRNQFNVQRQYSDGANIYEYVKSLPILNTDAFGLQAKKDEDKACCKTRTHHPAQAIPFVGGPVIIPARTTCTQVTINSKGASPGSACRCHYKNQKNVTVYDSHTGECCWCNIYQYRFPGGFLGLPSQAHQAINIVCEQGRGSWSADVWPESQDGITPYWPHWVEVKVGKGLNNSADGGHGLYRGRMSCDAADAWKSILGQAKWLYQFPFSECRDFVRRFGNEMSETCP